MERPLGIFNNVTLSLASGVHDNPSIEYDIALTAALTKKNYDSSDGSRDFLW